MSGWRKSRTLNWRRAECGRSIAPKVIANLRDHMTDLELIFSMLGEASTTEIARNKNAQGFQQNRKVSKEGGKIAGDARIALEKKSGRKVVPKQNYKELPEREVRKLSSGKKKSK